MVDSSIKMSSGNEWPIVLLLRYFEFEIRPCNWFWLTVNPPLIQPAYYRFMVAFNNYVNMIYLWFCLYFLVGDFMLKQKITPDNIKRYIDNQIFPVSSNNTGTITPPRTWSQIERRHWRSRVEDTPHFRCMFSHTLNWQLKLNKI